MEKLFGDKLLWSSSFERRIAGREAPPQRNAVKVLLPLDKSSSIRRFFAEKILWALKNYSILDDDFSSEAFQGNFSRKTPSGRIFIENSSFYERILWEELKASRILTRSSFKKWEGNIVIKLPEKKDLSNLEEKFFPDECPSSGSFFYLLLIRDQWMLILICTQLMNLRVIN